MQTFELHNRFQEKGGFFEVGAGICKVKGEKTAHFLHGQFTNDIKKLKNGEGNYNLLLTNKGKIVADLYVYRSGHDYNLLIDASFQQKVMEHLKKLAPLSRVETLEGSDNFKIIHVCAESEQILTKNLPSCSKYRLCTCEIKKIHSFCFRTDRLGISGSDLIVETKDKDKLGDFLKQRGLVKMNNELREIIRIQNGITLIGVDATEDNLPQESRIMHAISFDKGCYLGQEIIARLHYRGHVNKLLCGLKIDSETKLEGETPLFKGDKEVGKVTSAVFSPKLNSQLGLGYVPYGSADVGQEFLAGKDKVKAVIIELPLK